MGFNFLSNSTLRGEKATLGTSLSSTLTPSTIARLIIRFLQFVLGLTVIGLYAVDLDNARKANKYIDSKWVWAVVCGTLGALTSLVFMLPLAKAWFFFGVDAFVNYHYPALAVNQNPRRVSAPSAPVSPSEATITPPLSLPSYQTDPPVPAPQAPPPSVAYSTAGGEEQDQDTPNEEEEPIQSLQSWLALFPEHIIPFCFREVMS
ncbi:Uracil phosphoribosyltransferase [Stemphylium lycopersici]|uniref:Uracil phosphoribosyltransferase n=1 Tax=Stemphylium lycopersici TaxID=183478 RepID=A0A364N9A1_STELY|nr:hypothetical protein TW65_05066 [Stemphylium lycopersici]RAR03931.1 Uracil phosphoribosyltransferase [Stemphylium lycopersici]RAR13862.1 Uracil phosphoribosyltransferase [Stemphylium lycopersici]